MRVDKICITTTFDRNYIEAGKALFNSIKRYTNCKGVDFKVITADKAVVNKLGKGNCYFVDGNIKAKYSNVQYHTEWPKQKYASSWYRYEMYNMTQYDRVISIDADCICIKDISYLFSQELDEFDVISVEDHIVSKCFVDYIPDLEDKGFNLDNLKTRLSEGKIDIQPALMVANKSIINETFYNKLLTYANNAPFSYALDMGVLNDFIYMENLKIKLLPIEWNYQDVYELAIPEIPIPTTPIMIHCQESKPFKKAKSELLESMHKWWDLWWEENKPLK